jgi:biopolymer transport protein ExbB/TolQ
MAILPLLVILFIVSYAILTMLVFEQGQTIESQRALIREMLKDSSQLAALKGKLARDDSKRASEKASAQTTEKTEERVEEKGEERNTQPSTTAPGSKTEKDTKRSGKSARSTRQVPGRPPADLEDVRRATRSI